MIGGPHMFGVGLALMLGAAPPPETQTVRAEAVEARLFAWLDGTRGPLDGGVWTLRVTNHGTQTVKLKPSAVQVSGPAGPLQSCSVQTADAYKEGEKPGAARHYGYALKPQQTLMVRLVFGCQAPTDKRVIVDQAHTYGLAMTLSWDGGRVSLLTDKLRPAPHPAQGDGI